MWKIKQNQIDKDMWEIWEDGYFVAVVHVDTFPKSITSWKGEDGKLFGDGIEYDLDITIKED